MKSLAATLIAGLAYAVSGGAASAQISDDVVKIGVLTDMSSLYSDATGKGSLAAVQMAVADYGGKVKGKPIEVIAADHQNKPDVGVNIARNWYDNDKVDAIFDFPTSSVALPVSALTREKNKIHMNSGAGSSDITGIACSPNTVHWTYDTYALSMSQAKRWSNAAKIPGSLSPPTTPSAWRWSAMPPTSSRRAAAKCWARSATR
jgi:branched-chain amino acid transport system substrate-binding protein